MVVSDNDLVNVSIIDVTIDNSTSIKSYANNGKNISIFNSIFNGGLSFGHEGRLTNVTVKNCLIRGNLSANLINIGIIENNTINNGFLDLKVSNFIVKSNVINSHDNSYGIYIAAHDYVSNNYLENNTVYNYGHDHAILVPDRTIVINNRLFSNKFGNNAVGLMAYARDVVIENNTPANQIQVMVKTNVNKIVYDENIILDVDISAKGSLTVEVNSRQYDCEIVNGNVSFKIDEYHAGTNKIAVYYADVLNDIYGYAGTTFYVYKINECPIKLVCNNAVPNKFFSINVVLPDDARGIITLALNNDTHFVTINQEANGTNNIIKLFALSEGNYTVSATFVSDKYITNSTKTDISVVNVPVYKLTVGNIVMDYNDGSKYKVLVTKDGCSVGAGEIVKITFNGKSVYVKTDNKGYATLTLNAAPKTYTISAEYNGLVKSSKVTIKNVLKASNISKKKAKTIKFTATLKNSKGKAITSKKVTFKFKGKTYTAKTNKKGIATISLKNLKVGKYSITSKYGACTVKNTIIIKK